MIYLCRHGQTEFNLAGRYQGAMDSPLTALGEAQARRMGETLARCIGDLDGWRIVTSPLGRARRTAEIIAGALGHTEPLELEPRIAEVSMGAWDGLSVEELAARRPTDVPYAERYFGGPGGESLSAFSGRIADWLASVRDQTRLIVVSHGLAGRFVRGLYAGLPHDEMLTLPTPQDAIHRLGAGQIERIACEPA